MENYSCILYLKNNQHQLNRLIGQSLKYLGFEPRVMYVNLPTDETYDDVVYDTALLEKLVDMNAQTIFIKNKIYDPEGDNRWFKYSLDTVYQIASFQWSNSDLDFLIKTPGIKTFLELENFICGYCYNISDVFDQSNTSIRYFETHYPNIDYKVGRNFLGEDVVDISTHWGRKICAASIDFMAAAHSWYGGSFKEIISYDELLAFKYTERISVNGKALAFIKLFDLFDSPSDSENRRKQEEYWKFFDLVNKAEQYERMRKEELNISGNPWVKKLLEKKRKKR